MPLQRVDVSGSARVILGVLQKLGAGGKKATLIQLVDAWRREDKAAKAQDREENELVGDTCVGASAL